MALSNAGAPSSECPPTVICMEEHASVIWTSGKERLYTVSQKNVPPMACYNFETHEQIMIFFGRNVTDKVGNQKML